MCAIEAGLECKSKKGEAEGQASKEKIICKKETQGKSKIRLAELLVSFLSDPFNRDCIIRLRERQHQEMEIH
jgi:hypothetical protein